MDEEEELIYYNNKYLYDSWDSPYGPYGSRKPHVAFNENAILDTYTNWNSPQADKERTIFGEKEPDLFYNYSDRLYEWDYEKHRRANEYAGLVAQPKTAAFYAAMLSYFHDGAEVSLRHIIAGCNRSNGFPYLIFGYKYTSKPEDAGRLIEYDRIRVSKTEMLKQATAEFTAKFDEAMSDVLKNTNVAMNQ
jgi:hypothetical protein